MNQTPYSLAPWREPLARALHRNRALAYARYFQLATIRSDGRPANRTVVFRGFAEGCDDLMLISDRRSEKNQQILANAWGEACWYFPKTREQFRLSGRLRIVDETTKKASEQKLRIQTWQAISAKAREQFEGLPPGQPRSQQDLHQQPVTTTPSSPPTALQEQQDGTAAPLQLASNFSVILITPTLVDHLELRGTPQTRHRYEVEGDRSWDVLDLNP